MWIDFSKISKRESRVADIVHTFLGQDVRFKGQARFTGTVRIDGWFEGDIITEGALIVGDRAHIKGTIRCKRLISGGRVEGSVIASHKVHLLKSAVYLGEVRAPALSVEEGAIFHGFCTMATPDETLYALAETSQRSPLSSPSSNDVTVIQRKKTAAAPS